MFSSFLPQFGHVLGLWDAYGYEDHANNETLKWLKEKMQPVIEQEQYRADDSYFADDGHKYIY